MDVDLPVAATSIGSHTVSKGVWQTPDTVQTLLTYPNDLQVYFEGTFCNARNGAMLEFMGTNATLYLDRGRYEVIPERKRLKKGEPYKVEEYILGSGDRGRDFYDKPNGEVLHLTNWVECVKSRKKPNAPVEAGVSAASAAHLANQALRTGQAVKWKS
jgi:predicted dehydrogenase